MAQGCFRYRYGLALVAQSYPKTTLRSGYVRFASQLKLKHVDQNSRQVLNTPLPFAGLALSRAIRLGLKSAFPTITKATEAQATFIPAIIQGKDVIIKGDTGSGKSFGLILALLNKYWTPLPDRKRSHPESLLLVPHRDLAYQFMHWIESIAIATGGPSHSSPPAQVVVRGQEEPSLQLSLLRENPPSVLIGTPQAILDMSREDPQAINLSGLRTVVVDEVDYIIDFIPADPSRDRKKKLAAKMKRHPSAGKLLLDQIYTGRVRPNESAGVDDLPQLIVCSATLQTGLRQQLYQNGWFKKGVDSVVKVRSEMRAGETRIPKTSAAAADHAPEAEVVEHCALVFSEDGNVRDIEGAVASKRPSEDEGYRREAQTWTNIQGGDLPEMSAQLAEEHTVTPSAFDPVLMEGIASIFAMDVPKVALLVLPACAPVQRAVCELRKLGINAFGLDLLSMDRGRGHLIGGRGAAIEIEENPTVLVSTTASTRGIDLPDLSHVFVWGVVDANSYLHASGRVGRFGRQGRVVSVLREKGEGGQRDEPARCLRLLKSIGMTPTSLFN